MKEFIYYSLIFLLPLSMPLPIFSSDVVDAYTYFSMGYYYLYNNDLSMAKNQFELNLLKEKEPPSLIYGILAEVSNMLSEKKDAENYALKGLEVNPLDKKSLRITIYLFLEKGEYKKALPYLKRLLKQEPDNIQLLYSIADCYSQIKDDDKLIDIYHKMIQLNPNLLDIHLGLGYLYTEKGLFDLAIDEYEKVLELDPNNEKAIFYLTYIYFSEGKAVETLNLFEKLDGKGLLNDEMLQDYASNLFIEGKNPEPIIERIKDKSKISNLTKAIIFYRNEKLDKAKKLFEEVIKEDESGIASYIGLIRIAVRKNNQDMEKKWRFVLAGNYYKLQLYEKALDESKKVKSIDPYFIENRYLLGDIYNAIGVMDSTIEEYEFFKNNAKELGDVDIKLGISYDKVANHKKAIESFREAIELFPNEDKLYYYLGIEYRIIKDYKKAIDVFKKAAKIKSDNASYYLNIGISYERLGNIDEAITYLEKSVSLIDTNALALNYLGYILADKGIRLNEAMVYIKKALEIDPENGAYLDSMGWLYYRLGNFNKACENLKEAVKHMDKSEEENYLIYDHLGDTYYKLGLIDKSIEMWGEALKLKYIKEIEMKINKVKEERGN